MPYHRATCGRRRVTVALSSVLACFVAEGALATETASPEGRWRTIDDRTGRPRAIINVWIEDGQLQGRIARLCVRQGEAAEPVCTRCTGERRGQKVVGMLVLWAHRPKKGDRWEGGRLFDPESGKEHRGRLWLEGPDTLKVRGYWGPLFRTQTWHRIREPDAEGCRR